MKAKDLIANKTKARAVAAPSKEALIQLKTVLAFNEGRASTSRVSREAVLSMLAAHGWRGGRQALDRVCRALGRKSYSTP